MAQTPVQLRAAAAHDLDQAVDHYRREAGDSVALRFIDAVEMAVVRISRAPHSGTLRFAYELGIPDLRALPLGDFPYTIFYVEGADRVDVWRVLHSRRDIPTEITNEAERYSDT